MDCRLAAELELTVQDLLLVRAPLNRMSYSWIVKGSAATKGAPEQDVLLLLADSLRIGRVAGFETLEVSK